MRLVCERASGIDESTDVVNGRILQHAVVEIENVPGAPACQETPSDRVIDFIRRSVPQYAIIDVALKRDAWAVLFVRFSKINTSADTQHVCAGLHHDIQIGLLLRKKNRRC